MLFGIPSHQSRRSTLVCVLLYLFAQLLFLVNIQFPRTVDFDEFHYVPSAKQFLSFTENQNWEHPPLGKMLMAVGIAIGGDRPFGWRLMSTVFGALTLIGMYFWTLAIFRNDRRRDTIALWVALLTLFNHLLYVQARIGMLDTFMFAFLAWGCAAFCATWTAETTAHQNRRNLRFVGAMLGLAAATKWFAVVPWVSCIILVLGVRLLQLLRIRRGGDWIFPELWAGVRLRDWLLSLGLIPLVIYFLVFVPLLFTQKSATHGIWDLFLMQKEMYEGQLRVVSSHPYMSHWLDWPLLKRPIWYAFDKEVGGDYVRGVILLGNPLVMIAGFVAVLLCAWEWITRGDRRAFLIFTFYVIFYCCWAFIPRKISFYYYYYPAGMLLSIALAYIFERLESQSPSDRRVHFARWAFLAVSFVIFVYFFPVLAALKIHSDSFVRWMWSSSWI